MDSTALSIEDRVVNKADKCPALTELGSPQVAQWVKNPPAMQKFQEMRFALQVGKIPLEKGMTTLLS